MNRPPSSSGRPGTLGGGAMNRPPGTATRLTTGMAPGTAKGSGQQAGVGVALTSQVKVADRPMTKQGLSGMKTAGGIRGNQRLVQDKTFFLGLLRTKLQEISTEAGNLRREVEHTSEDQSSYVTYEKRAESLAAEIKEFQGELGDYNTLVDKLNTEESIADIQMDCDDLKNANDREAKNLDLQFEQKQKKQEQILNLELELKQEKSMADNMVADMPAAMKQKYIQAKEINEHLMNQLDLGQREVDHLQLKRNELEEELAASPVKQEAVRLYEQLHEVEEKRDQLIAEAANRLSPKDEREKLLSQVKDDNQEIAAMDRQTTEIREKLTNIQSELQQIEIDLEENQGERNHKYKELKKREETMDEFLNTFEETRQQELARTDIFQKNICSMLATMSRDLQSTSHLPSSNEFSLMKEDLGLKEGEMEKSKSTTDNLTIESRKLQDDLEKVETLEKKITTELSTLKENIDKMETELDIYSDLDRLKRESDERKVQLGDDKITLHKRREFLRNVLVERSAEYESLRGQLNENETFTQLTNLERKWQHLEQNNFVMKEFIASKTNETDARPVARKVDVMLKTYNDHLTEIYSGGKAM